MASTSSQPSNSLRQHRRPTLLRGVRFITASWKRFKLWYKGLYRGKPWWCKLLVAFATAIVSFILLLVAVDMNLLWLFGKSPSAYTIMHPQTPQASYIYSADGVEIGKYYDENRTPVPYDSINPKFFTVLIDTEDERFYSHHGIDYGGLAAAIKDLVLYGRPRGASTITQQLVKNMFRTRADYSNGLLGYIPGVKLLIMKSKEWIGATKVEIFYTKRQILEMYANTVDFGSNAYGIKTAAGTYFSTTPAALTVEQCAVLVGILKATSTYNPRINPKNSLRRRNVVLGNMLRQAHLTQQEHDSLCALPLELRYHADNPYSGPAPYFRQAVANQLDNWCRSTGHDLYRDGLKIYTTLDTRMQRHAERAVAQKMKVIQQHFTEHWGKEDCWVDDNGKPIPNFLEEKARNTDTYRNLLARYPNDLDSVDYYMNLPRPVRLFDYDNDTLTLMLSPMDSVRYMLHFLHTGFVAIEPQTGFVRAWVGDVDFGTWKYDKVTAHHQPGSTFKLFVYAAAMEHGLTPCVHRRDAPIDTMVYDQNLRRYKTWRPTNASGRFSNSEITLRSAFAQSLNSVTIRVALDVGIPIVAQTAREMGIISPLDETPALSLGASDVTLLELVGAYGTVADDGRAHPPVLVQRITDSKGKEIYYSEQSTANVLSYRSAFLMQKMLQAGRMDAGGTSQALNGYITPAMYDTDFGGKTGTSNRHADAWFVGVTPKLVCGAWVGGEYRQIHFRTGALGQGSRTALPICGAFLQGVLTDPALRAYHGRWPQPKQYIDPAIYRDCDPEPLPDSLLLMPDSLMPDSQYIAPNGTAPAPATESPTPADPAAATLPREE